MTVCLEVASRASGMRPLRRKRRWRLRRPRQSSRHAAARPRLWVACFGPNLGAFMRELEVDHGCDAPEVQLALDEALLLMADDGELGEVFRTWEFARPTVVIGRSSKVAAEVNRSYCAEHRIPVLRRCSGGAAIAAGPGCLMYSVVLDLRERPGLQKIDAAHRFVMERLLAAVGRQLSGAAFQGTCDLTWGGRKFSGNSLRLARHHLLYHGTVLYDADLERVAGCLGVAPRQPDYRRGRSHEAFITNVPLEPARLARDLASLFGVDGREPFGPRFAPRIEQLKRDRYRRPEWHHRH